MTKLDQYLTSLKPVDRCEVVRWMDSRPPEIRALLHRYPPGSTATIKGRTAFLLGYVQTTDEPGLYFSYIDPHQDYDAAAAAKFFVCGSHLVEEP
jgi:hypothetical protein